MRIYSTAAFGAALMLVLGSGPAAAQIVLKGGHISPKDSVEGIASIASRIS